MTDLRKAAQTVLDRWDSSEHAASDLFEELRAALEQPKGLFIDMIAAHGPEFVEEVRRVGENIEQPEQQAEPVAWMFQHEETGRIMCVEAQQVEGGFEKGNPRLKKIAPLYTTPPQRKPLTDADIKLVMDGRGEEGDDDYIKPAFDPYGISEGDLIDFARATEQARGIKGEA